MQTFSQFLTERAAPDPAVAKDRLRKKLARRFKDRLPEMERYFAVATPRNFLRKYNAFVEAFPEEAHAIDAQRPDGVGPGETLASFIFDNITVGGKSSSIDLFLDGQPWAEVKAGEAGGGGIQDFKLDTENAQSTKSLLKNLGDFNAEFRRLTGEDLPNWKGAGEAGTGALRDWRKLDLVDLGGRDRNSTIDEIEDDWFASVEDSYVRDKLFMLVHRKSLRAFYFGRLAAEMVDLLRTTRSQPKAAVHAAR